MLSNNYNSNSIDLNIPKNPIRRPNKRQFRVLNKRFKKVLRNIDHEHKNMIEVDDGYGRISWKKKTDVDISVDIDNGQANCN
jgi:hypothetical protein